MSFTRSDVLDMTVDEIEFFLEWLEERRNAEAEAIKKAHRKKST